MPRLGELLVQAGALTVEQLHAALKRQQQQGGRLGTHLVELGLLSESALARTLSAQLRMPAVSAAALEKAPLDVLRLLPRDSAAHHRAVPVRLDGIHLSVAMSDPTDARAIADLEAVTRCRIRPMVAPDLLLSYALERHYGIPPRRRPDWTDPSAKVDLRFDVGERGAVLAAGARAPTPFDDPYAPAERAAMEEHVLDLDMQRRTAAEDPVALAAAVKAAAAAVSAAAGPLTAPAAVVVPAAVAAPVVAAPVVAAPVAVAPVAVAPVAVALAVAPVSIAPAVPPPVTGIQPPRISQGRLGAAALGARLVAATTQSEVYEAALTFLLQDFERVVVLVVRNGRLAGFLAGGRGIDPTKLSEFAVPPDEVPIIARALGDGRPRLGRASAQTLGQLNRLLGPPSERATLVLPVRSGGEPAGLLVATAGLEGVEAYIDEYQSCARKLDLALQILFLRRRILDA